MREMTTNPNKKAVLERITHLDDAIVKAYEYLNSGKYAHWHGFRPLFGDKMRHGKAMPPHKKWVRNVFLPSRERALKQARKVLARLT